MQTVGTSHPQASCPVRSRRLKNYWEPIYNPGDDGEFFISDWAIDNKEYHRSRLGANELYKSRKNGRIKFEKVIFFKCDFTGNFLSRKNKLEFANCQFDCCDFGYSSWKFAKFKNCEFHACSISMSSFDEVQFLNCIWKKIGFSGNETKIENIIMTNPEEFINSGYTNLDEWVLKQLGTENEYQQMRLEKTKAKMAKIIRNSLENQGDDDAYYEAVKVYLNQIIIYKIAKVKYYANKGGVINHLFCVLKLISYMIEKCIINMSGFVNAWGQSIGRPILTGIVIVLFFAILYYWLKIFTSCQRSLIASGEITLLVGYTKYAFKGMGKLKEILLALNMFAGIWWYSVFIPTVINRICRVR